MRIEFPVDKDISGRLVLLLFTCGSSLFHVFIKPFSTGKEGLMYISYPTLELRVDLHRAKRF